jgi:predicted transcriptional regulator
MRTTIRINDELYRDVKATAARSGRTVAAVLEDALRRGLHADDGAEATCYELKALGRSGLRPGVDLSSTASINEALDEDLSLDAMR